MPAEKNSISARQLFIMFILATMSPSIRLFPSLSSRFGGAAGWLAPVISVLFPLALVLILSALFKTDRHGGFGDVLEAAFGKIASRVLLTLYLLWLTLLLMLYIRYYADRILSSLFPNNNPDFFIMTMLAVVFLASRGGLKSLARFCEVAVLIFAVVLVLFFLSLLPTFRAANVLPVTLYDAAPIARSSLPIISIWGYITLFFFFGEHIRDKERIKKRGVRAVLVLAVANAVMLLAVVGSLGYRAAARMPLPFFKVSKLINIMQSFDRFEAILMSVWVIADFIVITVFVFFITNIIKKLFALSEPEHLSSPVLMLGYVGALFVAASRYELERFSNSTVTHAVNLTLCAAVPALALAVDRLRRRVSRGKDGGTVAF